MIRPILAAMALALTTSISMAAEDTSLSTKAMADHPGTKGGRTTNATAKPETSSLSQAQMNYQPGVNHDTSGKTATPNAKPDNGSIDDKEMHENPGAQK